MITKSVTFVYTYMSVYNIVYVHVCLCVRMYLYTTKKAIPPAISSS